jgi:hypothetical protein
MDERQILEQRLATLNGLLDTRVGALGPAAGVLGGQLRSKWEMERRLLGRVLAETPGGDIRATLDLWGERTANFLEKNGDGASWNDKDGFKWEAESVLNILIDVEERLNSWLQADEPFDASDDGADEDEMGEDGEDEDNDDGRLIDTTPGGNR